MSAPPPLEIELKLRVPARAVEQIARHPAVVALKRKRARSEPIHALYFDTPDLRLTKAKLALRVRREGRRWVQAVKAAPTAAGAGLASRTEIQWPLGTGTEVPRLDLDRLLQSPYGRTFAKAIRKGTLAPVFATVFRRTTIPLAFPDGTLALLCLDVGEIRRGDGRGRDRRIPLSEVEIELETGAPARLFELAQALAADLPVAVEARSKAERGYALVRPSPILAVRAAPIELAADATAAQALVAIIANCLNQIEVNAPGIGSDHATECVHQMRVGTRRLRSCLALLRPHVPAEPLHALESEVRWLATTLGAARDLDVLLEETLPPLQKAAADPGDAGLGPLIGPLTAQVASRRATARARARAALRTRRFQHLLLSLGALCVTELPRNAPGTEEVPSLGGRADAFASGVLQRRHRKLTRAGEHFATATPDERHEIRIAAKRLRYAIDFFGSLFPEKRTRTFAKALARLQDGLGLGNDARVALQLAAEIAGPQSPTTAALAGWAAAQGSSRERVIAAAWKDFLECRPFWVRPEDHEET